MSCCRSSMLLPYKHTENRSEFAQSKPAAVPRWQEDIRRLLQQEFVAQVMSHHDQK